MYDRIDLDSFLPDIDISEISGNKVEGMSDLAEKQGYWHTIRRGFSPKFIDESGLVLAEYNLYKNPANMEEFRCADPECDEILVEIRLSIVTVMDKDATWYTIHSLAKDTAVYEALISTNETVVGCLSHDARAIKVVKKPEVIVVAPVTSIEEGKTIRARQKIRRDLNKLKLT